MACFIVPATEAIVSTVVTKVIEKKENTEQVENTEVTVSKERFSTKLKRLNYLLFGGSALLAFEHVWHGEVQPFYPFLTAAADPLDRAEMLHEMGTVGVAMAVVVTVAWAVVTGVVALAEKKAAQDAVKDVQPVKVEAE